MSLLDLSKKPARSDAPQINQCNVDEFIESARNYARGLSSNVRLRAVEYSPQEPKQPFRKATFTLSEQCIESLAELAQEYGISKSHLIRMMIRQMEDNHALERQLTICRYK